MVAFDLRASALAVFSLVGADVATPEALSLERTSAPVAAPQLPIIPTEARPQVNLEAVWWTAPRSERTGRLADRWGLKERDLIELNPGLTEAGVAAGDRVLVYRHQPGLISRSVGTPNRGRLENSVPFPEGEAWVLREFRPRSFATLALVTELAQVLTEWRERHPAAAAVKLGEFSRKSGGRAPPHKSHRAGRDVDVGYVMLQPREGHRFQRATKHTIDAEATWGLVHGLLASGSVEAIFMDASVQKLILPHAEAVLEPDQLAAYFAVASKDPRVRAKAKLRPWRGHDDHMHVRFACTEADLNCGEARSRKRRKKRRRGRKRRRR